MSEGPFTDDFVKHGLLTVQTQRGIIEYAEGMVQVLAEAGRASHKALGDSPEYAVRRWSDIIQKRALELLRTESAERMAKMKAKMENKMLASGE